MRKIWTQLGLTPWDYEINLLAEKSGNLHEAKSHVITKWMKAGDFRPMLAQIKKEGVLRGSALGLLVQMIKSGELAFKKGRGRRPDPEAAARGKLEADTYEDLQKYHRIGSDDLLDAIGKVTGVSEESVRRALTNKRKSKSSGST